jgi:molybdenum cofactor biosynthesis enzyme
MDKGIGIQQIVLERKTGGKSGDYRRPRRVEKKRSKK